MVTVKDIEKLEWQLAEKDQTIRELTKKVQQLTAWHDIMFGTPCEEIRHRQQVEQLQEDLDRVIGAAVRFAKEWQNPCGYPSQREASEFLNSPLVQDWRKRGSSHVAE